jgi:LacI family transcriptional regulator
MPPTQKELAKLAGVSSGTVSNVISGVTEVSERSRRKVLDAIKALNYQPNLIARSLRTNRTHTLGMVIPDITIPFFARVIRGAESAAREAGYYLSVLDSESNHSRETAMLEILRSQRVEGILLITAGGHKWSEQESATLLSGAPIVCLDRLPSGLEVDSVCVDDFRAAEMAVLHLIEKGHTKISVITGPLALQNEQERLRGYRSAMRRSGLTVTPSMLWKGSFESDDVARLCQEGLQDPALRPTALFGTNGVTGLAALRAMYAMGITTPKDIACVMFDELTTEDFFRPGITSVVQPAYDIGHRAVEVLLRRIGGGAEVLSLEKVRLPAKLIVRESSETMLASMNGNGGRTTRAIARSGR